MAKRDVILSGSPLLILFLIAPLARAEEEELPPPLVRGTVVDDRTGEPIPEFSVTFGDDASVPYWQTLGAKVFTKGRFSYEPMMFPRKAFRVQVRAKGYKAAASQELGADERDAKLEFRLVRPQRFAGVVRGPGGEPAAGATVVVATPGDYLVVSSGAVSSDEPAPPGDGLRTVKTDDAGRFDVAIDCERCRLVALDKSGFAEFGATAAQGQATLQPWGAIACSVELDGKPAAGVLLEAEPLDDEGRDRADDDPYVQFNGSGTTGADGKCVLERVPPGKAVVAIEEKLDMGGRDRFFGSRSVRETPFDVPASARAEVRIGGGGAEVIGRFTAEGRDVP
jgi:hypothetical protein